MGEKLDLSINDWLEVEVLKLLSRHVTSCTAAIISYGMIVVAVHWVLLRTPGGPLLSGGMNADVEFLVECSEAVVTIFIFGFSAFWFIMDLREYRKSAQGARSIATLLVA